MAIKASEIELLSNRYARAAFDAGKASSKLGEIAKEVALVANSIAADENAMKMLSSGAITKQRTAKLFADIAADLKLNDVTKSFLMVLAENKRTALLPQINNKLSALINAENNTVKAEVFSAKALNDNDMEQVKKSLEKSTGKTVLAENKVQKEMIGGLKVKVGSTLFDDSVATKLERLKQSLAN